MEELFIYLQSKVTVRSIIEIVIIAFFIYKLLSWLRGTQAEQVIKGIAVLLVLAPLTDWLGFSTLNFILTTMFTWAFIIIVVVFQPELRSALEKLGTSRLFYGLMKNPQSDQVAENIEEITRAVTSLSRQHIGALIVCEQNTGLNNIVETGITLDADISNELIENIFTPNRPLHDGAVIIQMRQNRIRAAGCLLPLSDNRFLGSNLGTRHRAGLGISEQSDAFTIIVSEETGTISYTEKGTLRRELTPEDVALLLTERFVVEEDDKDNNKFSKFLERTIGQQEKNR